MSQQFLHKLEKTEILRYFRRIYKISANRVLKRQITMVHIKSGIECLVLFQKTPKIVESTEIVERFAANPLCKKRFYHALNQKSTQNGKIWSSE